MERTGQTTYIGSNNGVQNIKAKNSESAQNRLL